MNIETSNITKTYQQKNRPQIWKTVICFLNPAKFMALSVPMDLEKTTLMKIMAGLIPPTAGNVLYNRQPLGPDIFSEMTYSTHTPTPFFRDRFMKISPTR